ncbi:hypothetical protein MPLB_1750004 [Mesorhizobium sp. ORS 3324]|nr:hypothetical protein MPLB_1750004 [Mesorhizobium sp. ORS 3324]
MPARPWRVPATGTQLLWIAAAFSRSAGTRLALLAALPLGAWLPLATRLAVGTGPQPRELARCSLPPGTSGGRGDRL